MRTKTVLNMLIVHGLAGALLLGSCAGCSSATPGTPSAPPATLSPVPATLVPPTPSPTPPPPQAAITLNPTAGSAGTQVTISSVNFPPDTRLNVHLGPSEAGIGLQSYVGGVTDSHGNAVMTFVMPDKWPDGQPIAESTLAILVATDDLGVKAAADFAYTAPPIPADYPQTPSELVDAFLSSLVNDPSGASSLVYLGDSLQREVQQGRSVFQILGLAGAYQSFNVDVPGADAGDSATFQVTLNAGAQAHTRLLVLSRQAGLWHINAVAAAENVDMGDAGQVTQDFLLSLLKDRSGESSLKYLSRRLAGQVQGGRSMYDILGVEGMYRSFSFEILSAAAGTSVIRVTLDYEAGPQVRTFSLVQEGGWRIDAVTAQ